jgi:hypothetical protein
MLGLGLSGPLIAEMLATQGTRVVQQTFTPTKRGGEGKLRLLFWQAPTILDRHFPVVWRHDVYAVSQTLWGMALSPWDFSLSDLAYWYRET